MIVSDFINYQKNQIQTHQNYKSQQQQYIIILLSSYFIMNNKPLWKRVKIHKEKQISQQQKSFKKLQLPFKYQNIENQLSKQIRFSEIKPIIKKQSILQQKIDIHQSENEDDLFKNFLQQYKQLNQQIVQTQQQIIHSKQIHFQQKQIKNQHKFSENLPELSDLMESLIHKIRKNQNQFSQQFVCDLNDKINQVRKFNINQLKIIFTQLFIVLKKQATDLKKLIENERKNFKKTLESILPQIQDYIELRKILAPKQYEDIKIQKKQIQKGQQQKIEQLKNMEARKQQQSINNQIKEKQIQGIIKQKSDQIMDLKKRIKQYRQNEQNIQIYMKSLQIKTSEQIQNLRLELNLQIQEAKYLRMQIEGQIDKKKIVIQELELKKNNEIRIKQYEIQNLKNKIELLIKQNEQSQNEILSLKKKIVKNQSINQKVQKLTNLHKKRQQQILNQISSLKSQNISIQQKYLQISQTNKSLQLQYSSQIGQLKKQNYLTLQQNFALLQKLQSFDYQLQQKLQLVLKSQRKTFSQLENNLKQQINTLKSQLKQATEKSHFLQQKLSQQIRFDQYRHLKNQSNYRLKSNLYNTISSPKSTLGSQQQDHFDPKLRLTSSHTYKFKRNNKQDKFLQYIKDQQYMTNPITNINIKSQNSVKNFRHSANQSIYQGIYRQLNKQKYQAMDSIKSSLNRQQQKYHYNKIIKPQNQKPQIYNKRTPNKLEQNRKSFQKFQFGKLQNQLQSLTKQLKYELDSVNKNKNKNNKH